MVTIKDVAKASGYSVSTVSYALNDSDNIPQVTKDKIWAVAKKLKYYPNAAARNLKNKSTNNIGFFISGFTGPVYHKIYDGVASVINNSKYHLILSFSQNAKRMIRERQIDAAIIMCPQVEDSVIEHANRLGMPVFVLDRLDNGDEHTYSHMLDSYTGAKLATQQLVDEGHQTIAYLSGIVGSFVDDERYRAFHDVISSNGSIQEKVYFGNFTESSGYELVQQLQGTLPFEAIFCANDEMAIGFIKGCMEYGISVPEDISVIGFDNVDISQYINGGLTTIDVDQGKWGSEVAQDLLDVLDGKHVDKQKVCPVQLHLRNTTKKRAS
ncbi:LacI family DNA-binding transcriptional regulator [Candidatus Xianfuyuplasma coldseepsis]|uniref:LacI family transcriptional regulator n=1 Tax=Candidatus Xianfuyuplasma coldseepsis TaxID=2782163 RepID=A0A7L7KRL9_9MOLU|nr:LacI family DNA-binding transcriptional regulator [Xianfuyuplasma coldseepsis]QMS85059.1 LacI family transcriptional regulator [Xianfuyuplasma coldseepsis]